MSHLTFTHFQNKPTLDIRSKIICTYRLQKNFADCSLNPFQILLSMAMGFANLADAMEMMILSILAPALQCSWHITEVQQATITTVVFLGKIKYFKW